MRTIEIVKKIEITDQIIDDIMITALEGGISYWCGKALPTKPIPDTLKGKGFSLAELLSKGVDITLFSDFDPSVVLTLDKFIVGLEKWLSKGGDLDSYDAYDTDCIIQYAVFNELVYG